ncbi:hypothetical protein [Pseudomonas graminis]|uniref:Ig-like domain (Group 3) n=1 Tax=Pseudomonas graminis TaxID=158627 RepID=A0A6M8MWT8_9PSED|nr:hypothetical protein [Pseudomonas graminis]QKF51747.1 hypothetical protein FX982_02715 [Pseudomonas graminis]
MKRNSRTLFPPLERDYSVMALRPLWISGMVTPVEHGDGGINIAIVEDNPSGMLSAVDPWLRMQEGDRIEVYWDGVMIADHDVVAADLDKRIIFFLPGSAAVAGWAEAVMYRLTRAGATSTEDSVPLRLRVKLDRPAGIDRDPHLPGHSELAAPQLPQDVIENGVDAESAAEGIPVTIATYPGRAARDTLELRWGSVSLRRQISEDEAAGSDPIEIIVDQATVLAAGDAESLLVHYQVYDEVWNFSTDWSLQTKVPVEAGAWKLDAPIIAQALNGVIDLGTLASADVTVQIPVSGAPFERGDTLTMTWLGTTAQGEELTYTESVVLGNIPSVYDTTVPNARVRALLDGKAEASYVLTKANGDPPQSSKRAPARITGTLPLKIPSILELIGDVLSPLEERAHVEIPVYEYMANGDLIDLIWLGTRVDGTPYLYEAQHIVTANEAGNVVYIPVMGEHIAPLENGTLDVSYRVSNDAWQVLDVRVSEHLHVRVGQHSASLPAPSILEAEAGVLDPELHPGDITLRVSYTGTLAGDILTWYWLGLPLEGSGSDSIPITTTIAGKPVDFTLPRAIVEPNINNEVRVLYTLRRGSPASYQYSATLNLIIGKLIGDLPAPTVLQASNGVLDPMDALNGVTVRVSYASMEDADLATLMWLGTPGTGSPADQEKPGSSSGQVEYTVPAPVIGANIGRDVSVSYRVKRYMAEKQSDILRLPVLPFGEPDKDLPHPVITQADSQTLTLNLATFTGNGTATVTKWPFIAAGQRVWFRLEGETSSGGLHTITLLDGVELTSAQATAGLSQSVLRTELERLGQDTRVTVICNVAFDGVASESAAVPLPRTVYTFKLHHDWVSPQIVSVKDSKGEVAEGGITFDTQLALTGTSTLEAELEILDGSTRLTTARANGSGAWNTNLSGLQIKNYSVTAHALDGSGLVSQPRRFEVLANLTPTITQVVDSSGPVSNGGTTVETSVTITGQGSPDQQIELFDGNASKGTARTNSAGTWSLTVSGLTVASHPFKAKALYGSQPESIVWTVTVAQNVIPTITSVEDSNNADIPDRGYTVDTSVTLRGAASANFDVQILDGATVIGTAKADAGGQWTLSLTGLSVAAHAVKAKALYGSGQESLVRTFTVTASVAPTITSIKDSQGQEIPDKGATADTQVTLTGAASRGLNIQVLDGATVKGTATADANGTWSLLLTGLSVASHAMKAKAVYGAGAESAVRSFTIIASVAPTITSIKDSNNVEIPPNGFTVETDVVLTGSASENLEVEIFDGALSQGKVRANAAGEWTLSLTGLSVAAHAVKAKALYGSGQESLVRTFTVTASVAPTITSIKDSQGQEIPDNGSTADTQVTLTGRASMGLNVQVLDGATVKGTATADANGNWSLLLTGLSVAPHAMKAKAMYGAGAESAVRSFTIIAAVTPTITSIKDSKNVEIPPNGFTVDTNVVLTGSANANLEVEIFDGTTSRGTVRANAGGQWTLSLTGLSVAAHAMKARANYANNPESPVRTFTVTAVVSPTITQVVEPNGTPVANNGSTFANTLTLSGKASINQSVEIYDGATSKGTADVNANGDWSRQVSGLGSGSHSLTAKALYASNPVSSPWTVNVLAATVPTVTSVRDSQKEISNGGKTTETAVTVKGNAAANQQVEVFDNSTSKGKVSVTGAGEWTQSVSGLALGGHSIKAVARYGDEPESNVRTFTVESPVPPLVIDPSTVALSSKLYRPTADLSVDPVSWPANSTSRRTPSSGAPPYTYTSSNSAIVKVAGDGTIYSQSNGNATITVRDSQGRSGSYPVSVSGVILVHLLGNTTYKAGLKLAAANGKRIPSLGELREIHAQYGNRWPQGEARFYSWSTDGAGLYKNWVKNLVTSDELAFDIKFENFGSYAHTHAM